MVNKNHITSNNEKKQLLDFFLKNKELFGKFYGESIDFIESLIREIILQMDNRSASGTTIDELNDSIDSLIYATEKLLFFLTLTEDEKAN